MRVAANVATRVVPSTSVILTQVRTIRFRKRMGRGYSHRVSMMKNMLTSLIEFERIKTGITKAREVCRLSDKMITKAKRGGLEQTREAAKYVKTTHSLTKLFTSAPTQP